MILFWSLPSRTPVRPHATNAQEKKLNKLLRDHGCYWSLNQSFFLGGSGGSGGLGQRDSHRISELKSVLPEKNPVRGLPWPNPYIDYHIWYPWNFLIVHFKVRCFLGCGWQAFLFLMCMYVCSWPDSCKINSWNWTFFHSYSLGYEMMVEIQYYYLIDWWKW